MLEGTKMQTVSLRKLCFKQSGSLTNGPSRGRRPRRSVIGMRIITRYGTTVAKTSIPLRQGILTPVRLS